MKEEYRTVNFENGGEKAMQNSGLHFHSFKKGKWLEKYETLVF